MITAPAEWTPLADDGNMFVQVADGPSVAISNWQKCLGVAVLSSVVASHKITFLNVEVFLPFPSKFCMTHQKGAWRSFIFMGPYVIKFQRT